MREDEGQVREDGDSGDEDREVAGVVPNEREGEVSQYLKSHLSKHYKFYKKLLLWKITTNLKLPYSIPPILPDSTCINVIQNFAFALIYYAIHYFEEIENFACVILLWNSVMK